ncbi:hypothetical protein BLNAU_19516 [Blattamonas nauphoetae]|nr:hypothetical protein BLNAU_19516 [Blattamonas nauphoetae]
MPELNQVSFSQGCLLALSLNFHDIGSGQHAIFLLRGCSSAPTHFLVLDLNLPKSTAAFPLPKVTAEMKMLEKVPNMPELNQVSFSQGCLLALSLNCHDLVSADEAFVFDCFEFTANCQFIEPVPLVVGLVTGNLARNLSSAVNLRLPHPSRDVNMEH